jgi:dynein assembly factor 1
LQQNCIAEIENLDCLVDLDTLNLNNNMVKRVQGLDKLQKLSTLQLQHNFLSDYDSLLGLLDCPSITVLDLAHNKIDDPRIVEILENMPHLVQAVDLGGTQSDGKHGHLQNSEL